MQRSIRQKILRNSFVIAVILHLLFFLSISTVFTFNLFPADPAQEKEEKHYVPSYVYTGAVTPPTPSTASTTSESQPSKPNKSPNSHSRYTKKYSPSSPWGYEPSIMSLSQNTLRQSSMNQTIKNIKHEEPMLLIGDQSQVADPLIALIGRSLSAHFSYPKMEGSFAIRGRVLVQLVLHPEGFYTDVQIVKSSDNHDFDAAALYAVNKAPRVIGADRLITKPKYLVVGFIFD